MNNLDYYESKDRLEEARKAIMRILDERNLTIMQEDGDLIIIDNATHLSIILED